MSSRHLSKLRLTGFLTVPGFERVWVLQEIWFAREAEVFCGKHTVPWKVLVYTFDYLDMNKKLHLTKDQFKLLPYVIQIEGKRRSSGAGKQESLLQKLHETRHCKSTDPRDKIYSLLAIAPDSYNQVFGVDYSKSVVETFTELAKLFIIRDRCFDVLGAVQGGTSAYDLPSWVPGWTSPLRVKVIGYPNPPDGIYRASNNLPAIFSFSTDARTLSTRGRCFDIVSVLGEEYLSNSQFSNSVLRQWAILASSLHPYPTGQDLQIAYLETFLASNTKTACDGQNRLIQLFLSSWRLHFFDEIDMNDRTDQRNHGKTLAEAQIFNDFVKKACGGRRFFTTVSGYMGLAPATAQSGDKICLLLGGQVPYILREEENHYKLVGESYVHGIMRGEALQGTENDIRDFEIR